MTITKDKSPAELLAEKEFPETPPHAHGFVFTHLYQREGFAKGYAAGQEDRWISVEERLPEKFQIVALVHVDKWWNTGRDEGVNCYDAGYLNEFGEKYWSVRGERALSIDAYTHWMPLPAPPAK